MLAVAAWFNPVADELEQSTRLFRAALDCDQPAVRDLCEYVERYHGKQLRPVFAFNHRLRQ